jgi:hypothetical protein
LKNLNTASGRYELKAAKDIIDSARNAFRQLIHAKIAQLDRASLLLFCIEQNDALNVKYKNYTLSIEQSLHHEVDFDRSQMFARAYDEYVRDTRNYRYVLECRLSAPPSASGSSPVTAQVVSELVASVDWLFVLYTASDVLHNDIGVAV